MSFRWTDALSEPLARVLGDGDWTRVEESRCGGWLLRAGHGDEERRWHLVRAGDRRPTRLHPFDDPSLPALEPAVAHWSRLGHEVELLAWRVHRRAVCRVTAPGGSHICKFYAKDRAVLARWSALPPASRTSWRSPRVVDWDADRRCLTTEDCPGVSLHRLWMSGRGHGKDGDEIGAVLDWLGTSRVPTDLPEYGARDEIDLLWKRLASAERLLCRPRLQARELTARVTSALERIGTRERRVCHRDLHDKQILLAAPAGTVLDLDLVAAGPPELDAGNILAHLRLRALQGADLPWRLIAGRIALRTAPSQRTESALSVWTAAALLRLASIYSHRRRPEGMIHGLLDSAEAALGATGEWEGLVRAA